MLTAHSHSPEESFKLPERSADLRVVLQPLADSDGKRQFRFSVVSPYQNLLGSYLVRVEPGNVERFTGLFKEQKLVVAADGGFGEQALNFALLTNVLRGIQRIQADAIPNIDIDREISRLREAQAKVSKIIELNGWKFNTGLVGLMTACNADSLNAMAGANGNTGFVWLDITFQTDSPASTRDFEAILRGAFPQVFEGSSQGVKTSALVPTLRLFSYYDGQEGLQRSPVFAAVGKAVFITAGGENSSPAIDYVNTELKVLSIVPADSSSLLLRVVKAAKNGTAIVLRKYEEALRELETRLNESELDEQSDLERLNTLIDNLAQMKLDQAFLVKDLADFSLHTVNSSTLEGWQQARSVAAADIDVMRELHEKALLVRSRYQEELEERQPRVEEVSEVATNASFWRPANFAQAFLLLGSVFCLYYQLGSLPKSHPLGMIGAVALILGVLLDWSAKKNQNTTDV